MVSAEDSLVSEKCSIAEEKMLELSLLAEGKTARNPKSLELTFADDRPISPVSVTQSTFLRRLRTSLARTDRSRSYLCASSGAPLIVISHFPFHTTACDESRLRRSRSSIGSTERLQQSALGESVEELRPFDFRDVECIHFEQLSLKLRRSSAMSYSGVAWKPSREERRVSEAPVNSSLTGLAYIREDSEPGT
ncbi:hypothetical protein OESDEN_13397 [Oesophagostomum dentatum]|uniref:Uncharacterized protein n=1 Tax=Oesophagostomum dentatum TaxID=61180 RepID=A0A0B1STH4_OESDE|nr:hypothetical protein OESDEN_13397 [Oesophagostomum dentatum]